MTWIAGMIGRRKTRESHKLNYLHRFCLLFLFFWGIISQSRFLLILGLVFLCSCSVAQNRQKLAVSFKIPAFGMNLVDISGEVRNEQLFGDPGDYNGKRETPEETETEKTETEKIIKTAPRTMQPSVRAEGKQNGNGLMAWGLIGLTSIFAWAKNKFLKGGVT